VIWKHIEARHTSRESWPKKRDQMGLERLFGSPLNKDGDFQGRAPRRPVLHNSSRE
jgi:hypothetical protein